MFAKERAIMGNGGGRDSGRLKPNPSYARTGEGIAPVPTPKPVISRPAQTNVNVTGGLGAQGYSSSDPSRAGTYQTAPDMSTKGRNLFYKGFANPQGDIYRKGDLYRDKTQKIAPKSAAQRSSAQKAAPSGRSTKVYQDKELGVTSGTRTGSSVTRSGTGGRRTETAFERQNRISREKSLRAGGMVGRGRSKKR